MWKILSTSQRAFLRRLNSQKSRRTFLSESYRCTDAWNARLESPLLSKVNAREMFVELDQKFQKAGRASALDVDVYANVIAGADHANELIDVLHKLRLTAETTATLDSTHHAVIRYLLDNDEIDDLLTILHDRMNYGIFPDHHCFNILMDTFLERKDYASAAKIAVLMMIQEDAENPIANALAIYSCHKYLENPEVWKAPEPEPVDTGEEVKVRVKYLRNPFFDDHFDLKDPSDLVGKTLVFFGKTMDDALGRSCYLRGLVLWKKFSRAADLIREWEKKGQKECIYRETLAKIQEYLSGVEEDKVSVTLDTGATVNLSPDVVRDLKTAIEGLAKSDLKEGSILEEIESRTKAAVETQAEVDIAKQLQTYQEWEKTRMSILEKQMAELDKKARLEKVEQMKKNLAEKERLLTFFENKSKIELQISEKLNYEKRRYGKVVQIAEDVEKNYVPPELIKKRKN